MVTKHDARSGTSFRGARPDQAAQFDPLGRQYQIRPRGGFPGGAHCALDRRVAVGHEPVDRQIGRVVPAIGIVERDRHRSRRHPVRKQPRLVPMRRRRDDDIHALDRAPVVGDRMEPARGLARPFRCRRPRANFGVSRGDVDLFQARKRRPPSSAGSNGRGRRSRPGRAASASARARYFAATVAQAAVRTKVIHSPSMKQAGWPVSGS